MHLTSPAPASCLKLVWPFLHALFVAVCMLFLERFQKQSIQVIMMKVFYFNAADMEEEPGEPVLDPEGAEGPCEPEMDTALALWAPGPFIPFLQQIPPGTTCELQIPGMLPAFHDLSTGSRRQCRRGSHRPVQPALLT